MIEEYLRRLGLPWAAEPAPPPSAELLNELHRAHQRRVPYTNMMIMLGFPGSGAQRASVEQVVAGHGGYCFILNGAFAWLLRELGFAVTLHRGYVSTRIPRAQPAEIALNHLVLLVHDLPTPRCPEGVWLADAGLGDALHEPLPLVAGEHRQGPFTYGLAPSAARDGWEFTHHPGISFTTMEFESAAAVIEDFAGAHRELSTSPSSPFTRILTAERWHPGGIDILRGCTLTSIDEVGRRERAAATREEWIAILAECFGLEHEALPDLWPSVSRAHAEWLAQRDGAAVRATGTAA